MADYLFTAYTQSGKELADSIEAESAAAARAQLEAMGLRDVVVHTDDFAARMYGKNLVNPPLDLDPAVMLKMQKKGGQKNLLLETLKANGVILLVLLGWNAYSFYSNNLNLFDWVGFGFTGLMLVVIVVFSVPALLFESVLQAQLWAHWDDAIRRLSLLRIFGRAMRIGPHMLDYYQAKNLIGLGRVEEGMALFARHRGQANVPDMLWLSLQASLLDEAKRRDEAGEIMRQLTVMMPDSAQVWLDLALNRAMFGDLDTARQAIAEAEQREMSPVMAAVAQFVRGEIALREGRHEDAESLCSKALVALSPYLSQTALHPLFIGIEARYAVALARCGKMEAAHQAWAIASPLLAAHGEQQYLDDWNAAVAANGSS